MLLSIHHMHNVNIFSYGSFKLWLKALLRHFVLQFCNSVQILLHFTWLPYILLFLITKSIFCFFKCKSEVLISVCASVTDYCMDPSSKKFRPQATKPNKYEWEVGPGNWVSMPCAPGTVFSVEKCGCIRDPYYVPSKCFLVLKIMSTSVLRHFLW